MSDQRTFREESMRRTPGDDSSLKRSIVVVCAMFATAWFLPIYFDGTRSVLLALFRSTLTVTNRDWFSIAAAAVLIPIAYAWKHSPRAGVIVQLSLLAGLAAWSATRDPAIMRTWWSYAGKLALVCGASAGGLSVVMWLLAAVRVSKRKAD
jgi:hypothetical protein